MHCEQNESIPLQTVLLGAHVLMFEILKYHMRIIRWTNWRGRCKTTTSIKSSYATWSYLFLQTNRITKICFCSPMKLLRFVQTNSPTLVRQEDGLRYIRIWATPPRRLVFCDGALSPYKWYQSHAPDLVMCGRSPMVDGEVPGTCKCEATRRTAVLLSIASLSGM